ncbi:MAG: RNA polymerase sigma factor [Planctomycetales bacterium]
MTDDVKMDPAAVAALYVQHAHELRCFLLGLVRDADLANEALQAAFAKAVELGHTSREETRKAWLFRVAMNEAFAIRRRANLGQEVTRKIAWTARTTDDETPDVHLTRYETVERIRAALEILPKEQQQVVRMRIYDEKTFAVIAAELGAPLGTVLTRMRLAMRKLKQHLEQEGESHDEY